MSAAQVPVGRLSICPTPIGNLRDVTLRTLDRLGEADLVACEDTRRTRVLLDRYELKTKLVSFHEHNERERVEQLKARIRAGDHVALVSDAGMPLVSDPGYLLVRGCLDANLPVEVLPGPSAVVAALVASGLPAERFEFVGFLPRKRSELQQLLGDAEQTILAFESPHRLAQTLAIVAEREPARQAVVCRELTKAHEEVRRGQASELAAHYAKASVRGEIVLVLAPASAGARNEQAAIAALRELVKAGARKRSAASVVAALTGVSANELYRALTDEPPAPPRQ
jgi:16S rRNA (cytidine1402-2'-O)-methyltransferase